ASMASSFSDRGSENGIARLGDDRLATAVNASSADSRCFMGPRIAAASHRPGGIVCSRAPAPRSRTGVAGTCNAGGRRLLVIPHDREQEATMRAQFLALTCLATAFASGALAQPTAPPMKTFMSSKEIMSLVDKAKADRKNNAPLV